MKKNVLAMSIAAMVGGLGFAGAASAQTTAATELRLAESGTGHILVVPYFNTQNNNMSVFHVVNTDTSNGKAVKVRFRSASNSDDVLDFQVFLSPGDVWTGFVRAGANQNDVSELVTFDNSCTLPAIQKGVPVKFVQDRLNPNWSEAVKANNTREGYVEMFNMADIKVGSPLYTATKHVNGVAPCTDAALSDTLATGATTPGLANPTTGLTGSWYIINVPETTTYSGAANVIRAVDNLGNPGFGRNVFSAQDAGAPAVVATADPLLRSGLVAAANYDLPDLSTPYLLATLSPEVQVDSLTEALAVNAVINQFANDASISAKTDWVFSMPTRRYAIAANYRAPVSNNKSTIGAAVAETTYRVYNGGLATNNYFTSGGSANTSVNESGQICVNALSQAFYDREETGKTSGAVFSPGAVRTSRLCGEVSVLSFNDSGNSVLGASVARQNVSDIPVNGWGQINFSAPVSVLGASFMKVTNPNVRANISGNYGITWPHAYVAPVKTAPVTP